jgi:CspA family cold shock protein
MAATGREVYEDQGARIPILARSQRFQRKAGYIEADRFQLSVRNRLRTGGGPYIFNTQRGFGFIEPDDGSKDAFVHISAVERAGLSSLTEGQKVSYELQPGRNGKSSAENLSVVE